MLENGYDDDSAIRLSGAGKSLERCKPDYETMISRQTEVLQKEEVFRDALLVYFRGKQARKGMAELIGEIVTKCNMLRDQLDALMKQQEKDSSLG
ncbi:MAG: hypothetical protein KAV87_55665 [Desulfobacteraceae bacterium]|nr:hypothetical protein [Desulfobacteraceae bacterium]